MSAETREKVSGEEEFVVQDGVRCPSRPPWAPRISKITSLTFLPIVLIALYTLAHTSVFKLFLWVLLLVIFAYPLRYLVCARCPYYGERCSTMMGLTVPRMFRKQEGRSMLLGLWLDVAFFLALFLIPLPDVWQLGGFLLLALWFGAFAVMIAAITRMACSVCPLAFCPIGRAGRAIWGRAR
jgi:hypothetical protein